MRAEWRHYWREVFKRTRSGILALGVSLIFWLFSLPQTPRSDYLSSLGISLLYGLTIYGLMWIAYAFLYAAMTYRKIRWGIEIQKLNWKVQVPFSLFATAGGLIGARWLECSILEEPFSTSGLMDSIVVGFFIAFMFMFYYAYRASAEENMKLRAAQAEAELHNLKNQMQPHFLFNSLNSLSELIETNQGTASEMAMKLSDLYREILQNSKHTVVSLESEVSIIRKYLELEQVRFGERLKFEIEVPQHSNSIFLPPLVLQTLVENSVKHGVSRLIEGGLVRVSVDRAIDDGFELAVINPCVSAKKSELSMRNKSASRPQGSGTGIVNTISRLDLLYGERHRFSARELESSFEVRFWFLGEASRG